MKIKLIFLLIICLALLGNDGIELAKGKRSGNTKKVGLFGQQTNNRLEIITYLLGKGSENGRLGMSVAGIGDVNLDGYDDVLIGNPDNGPGEAWLLFGGAEMDSIPDLIFRGEQENSTFGVPVVRGGDINGDGAPDFLIGATNYGIDRGRIYLYFGGALLDTIPDLIITGDADYIMFGMNIIAGDLNGDGCNDILTSVLDHNHVRGTAYIFYGGDQLDTIPDWINNGDTAKTYFGSNLAIGDVNGDQKNDILIISVPNGVGKGAMTITEIYLNKCGFDTIPDYSLVQTNYGDAVEEKLLCNDFNQDGIDDFLTPYYRDKIFYGSPQLDLEPDAQIDPYPYTYIKYFRNAGDVNGDGYPDILGGAPNYFFETGSVQLWLGSKNINSTVDWVAGGNGIMGIGLNGAGDVNGDGYDDLIVTDQILAFTSRSKSYVYILAGNPNLKDLGATNVADRSKPGVVGNFKLKQNYPNPFNNQTIISYELTNKEKQPVQLMIYNINGKEVRSLVNRMETAGEYRCIWDGKDNSGNEVDSGVYLGILQVNKMRQVIKMLLVK